MAGIKEHPAAATWQSQIPPTSASLDVSIANGTAHRITQSAWESDSTIADQIISFRSSAGTLMARQFGLMGLVFSTQMAQMGGGGRECTVRGASITYV
jgi:hypothetical protein